MVTDDCFKIRDLPGGGRISAIEGGDPNSQRPEEWERLRIPNFPVSVRKDEAFHRFLNGLMYDVGSRSLLMQPIPPEVGMLQFEIVRKQGVFTKLHPEFHLFLEKGGEERVSILFAKKRPFNKTANFLISQECAKTTRKGDDIIGKLRSNENKERYYLYNNGENPKDVHKVPLAGIRNEYLSV